MPGGTNATPATPLAPPMHVGMAAFVCVYLLLSLLHNVLPNPVIPPEDEFHFKTWMSENRKSYELGEYYHRLHIFTQNRRRILEHNARKQPFTMGLNQFSDLTFAEFKKVYLLHEPQNCSATVGNHPRHAGPYPDYVDWRERGNYVTPVKNQGHCGSCWTFSTTGCMESVTAIATGKLLELSEQQLIDCAQEFNNHGCFGGLPSQAFEYIRYRGGLMTEEDYPYKGHDSSCNFDVGEAAAFVRDVVNITQYDELGMLDAVARLNPVSFAYEVTADFVHYKDGIYSSTKCKNTTETVNHAVLAVGYGTMNGTAYWIVKNSWGTSWGKEGYFLIERGQNMCGLAACSSYPVALV